MDEKQIDAMVDKFLGWKLPEDFAPDGGIYFSNIAANGMPTGTNLFTATQAKAMIKFMLGE